MTSGGWGLGRLRPDPGAWAETDAERREDAYPRRAWEHVLRICPDFGSLVTQYVINCTDIQSNRCRFFSCVSISQINFIWNLSSLFVASLREALSSAMCQVIRRFSSIERLIGLPLNAEKR